MPLFQTHLSFCIEIYIPAKVIVIHKYFIILDYNLRDPASGSRLQHSMGFLTLMQMWSKPHSFLSWWWKGLRANLLYLNREWFLAKRISDHFEFWITSRVGEIQSFAVLTNLIWVAVSADDQHLLRCEPVRFVLLSIILNKHSPFLLVLLIQLWSLCPQKRAGLCHSRWQFRTLFYM